jgi:hypothetical protein
MVDRRKSMGTRAGGKKDVRRAVRSQSRLESEEFTRSSFARMEAQARRELDRTRRRLDDD